MICDILLTDLVKSFLDYSLSILLIKFFKSFFNDDNFSGVRSLFVALFIKLLALKNRLLFSFDFELSFRLSLVVVILLAILYSFSSALLLTS
jgi:hypothetical protein